MGRSETD
jgi:hypothetical protein